MFQTTPLRGVRGAGRGGADLRTWKGALPELRHEEPRRSSRSCSPRGGAGEQTRPCYPWTPEVNRRGNERGCGRPGPHRSGHVQTSKGPWARSETTDVSKNSRLTRCGYRWLHTELSPGTCIFRGDTDTYFFALSAERAGKKPRPGRKEHAEHTGHGSRKRSGSFKKRRIPGRGLIRRGAWIVS